MPAVRSFASPNAADSLGTLTIPFSPFNTWYEVNSRWEGRFLERTTPGTFADTIAKDRGIMRSLFDHGHDPQIGNKVLGPIVALREDATSPVGEVELLDTGYNRDLLPGLKAGVYGSSFRMHVQADDWDDNPPRSEHNPDGIPERTITRVRALEFGPVTFPANPAATATVRSGTDYYYDQLRNRDTSAFEAAARAAGWVPADLTGRPNAWSVGGGDSGGRPDSQKPAFNHRQRLDDGALRTRGNHLMSIEILPDLLDKSVDDLKSGPPEELRGKTPDELQQYVEVLDAHLRSIHQDEDTGELRDKTAPEQKAFDYGLKLRDAAIRKIEEHRAVQEVFRRRPARG
jgi:HK97 family phage prohead protease